MDPTRLRSRLPDRLRKDPVVMERRRFMAVMAGTLLTARLAVGAQQAERVYRIVLFHVSLDHVPPALYGLRQGLKELDMRKARICAGTSATCPMKRPRKRRHGNSFGSGWM
jgi:hypothetical protein